MGISRTALGAFVLLAATGSARAEDNHGNAPAAPEATVSKKVTRSYSSEKFDKSGLSVGIRISSSDRGEDLSCPTELQTCAAPQNGQEWPKTLVIDPGHADTQNGNRSNFDYEPARPLPEGSYTPPPPVPPAFEGAQTQWIVPERGQNVVSEDEWERRRALEAVPLPFTDPERVRIARESIDREFPPELNEGKSNMAVSLLTRDFFQKCFARPVAAAAKKTKSGASAPEVKLTRYPGETRFGEYSDPKWAPQAEKEIGGHAYIFSEVPMENTNQPLNTAETTYRVNREFAPPDNHRVAYINRLLGHQDPFYGRVMTKEEKEARAADPNFVLPKGVFDPSDASTLANGWMLSVHANTSTVPSPERRHDLILPMFPTTAPTFDPPTRDRLTRAFPAPESDDAALADQRAFGQEVGNAVAQSTAPFYRGIDSGDSVTHQPPYAPDFTPKVRPVTQSLGVLNPNVRAKRKLLMESYEMTGFGRERIIREVREGSRNIKVQVTGRNGKAENYEYKVSDLQIQIAKGLAVGLSKQLCGAPR